MKLVVAEKPSVAQSLAAVLGAKQKKQGYLEGGGFLVSWCVGHLVGLAPADAYDPKYSEWTYEDLPIIPKEWQFTVDPGKKEQFKVLSDLMNRADVDSLVCATDAGREGELIFRLVYHQAGCHKRHGSGQPMKRNCFYTKLPNEPLMNLEKRSCRRSRPYRRNTTTCWRRKRPPMKIISGLGKRTRNCRR